MILMENELSEKQKQEGIKILNSAKIKYSGQNKVWVSGVVLLKSLLLRNADSVRIAGKSIQQGITGKHEGRHSAGLVLSSAWTPVAVWELWFEQPWRYDQMDHSPSEHSFCF